MIKTLVEHYILRPLALRFAIKIIEKAQQRPYFDLKHADDTLYMGRWWLVPFADEKERDGCFVARWHKDPFIWLFQKLDMAMRVHYLATADIDRHLHDHPWDFISVVLRGGYVECRPVDPIGLTFDQRVGDDEFEQVVVTGREAGSVCYRKATDRHKIMRVMPGTYTLFITFKKRQWWGFYTPLGKIAWWKYESKHKSSSQKYGQIG